MMMTILLVKTLDEDYDDDDDIVGEDDTQICLLEKVWQQKRETYL